LYESVAAASGIYFDNPGVAINHALPAFAFLLAARGELQFGGDPQSQVRFFMVQQADAEGVGWNGHGRCAITITAAAPASAIGCGRAKASRSAVVAATLTQKT
jgi:hypothetical protein